MFNEIVHGNVPSISSSSPNGLFASLISSENSYCGGGSAQYSIDQTSLAFPQQSFSFGSDSLAMFFDNNQSTTHLLPNSLPWSTTSSLTSLKEPHQDVFDLPMDFGVLDEFFQTGDFNISQWFPQSPGQSNVTLNDHLLSQSTGFLPISSDEKVKPLTISGIDVDMLGCNGDLGDIVTPLVNENYTGFDSYNSGVSKSTQNIDNDMATLPPKKGLFSNLGIKELFEGISSTSTSCIEDQVSSAAKRRKLGNSILKSEPGLWASDSYSMDGSSTISQTKKQVEPTKPTKKKAKPGTRPRPKDRQMILDRMAELRELIPNGEKVIKRL